MARGLASLRKRNRPSAALPKLPAAPQEQTGPPPRKRFGGGSRRGLLAPDARAVRAGVRQGGFLLTTGLEPVPPKRVDFESTVFTISPSESTPGFLRSNRRVLGLPRGGARVEMSPPVNGPPLYPTGEWGSKNPGAGVCPLHHFSRQLAAPAPYEPGFLRSNCGVLGLECVFPANFIF